MEKSTFFLLCVCAVLLALCAHSSFATSGLNVQPHDVVSNSDLGEGDPERKKRCEDGCDEPVSSGKSKGPPPGKGGGGKPPKGGPPPKGGGGKPPKGGPPKGGGGKPGKGKGGGRTSPRQGGGGYDSGINCQCDCDGLPLF